MQGHFVQKLNININEEKLSLRGKTFFQASRLTVWENGTWCKQNSGLVNFVPESRLSVVQIDLFSLYAFPNRGPRGISPFVCS